MQFAFVVSSGLGYHIPNLYQTEDSFEEFRQALKCLKENGFDGVELNLHFDNQRLLTTITDFISDSGLKLAAVGTGLLYGRENLSFASPNQKKRAKAILIVTRLLNFASKFKAPLIIGSVRGEADTNNGLTRLRDSMIALNSAANRYGARIALEAINRYETKLLNSASEVSAFIQNHKLDSTGILLDTFHMNIEEQSIEETINTFRSKLVHFHIADSNRWPPSYGHLKLEEILRQLANLGYGGWVSVESLPKPNSVEAVKATAKFLRSYSLMQP